MKHKILLTIATLSGLVLLAAIATQYGWLEFIGIKQAAPCPLCIWARIPYIFAIAICALGLLNSEENLNQAQIRKITFGLLTLCFAAVMAISTYHIGIEFDIFPPPELCGGNQSFTTIEDLKAAIANKVDLAACHIPAKFLGLSMAIWNFIISFDLFLVSLLTFLNRKIFKGGVNS